MTCPRCGSENARDVPALRPLRHVARGAGAGAAEARDARLLRPVGLDRHGRARRCRGGSRPDAGVLRRDARRRSSGTAAPSRSSSATPCSQCSACRRRTRTTRCAPAGRRSRCRRGSSRSTPSSRVASARVSRSGSGSTPARSWRATHRAGETFVTGDAVNVAARLEQAAASGEVLIGEPTLRLVRGAVRAEAVRAAARERQVGAGPRLPTPRCDRCGSGSAPRGDAVHRPRGRARPPRA